jgi:hypothetical protein
MDGVVMNHQVCLGCGNVHDIDEIRAAGALSCCPERQMVDSITIVRAIQALETIADIAEGSTTANSLPHIGRLARAALPTRNGESET